MTRYVSSSHLEVEAREGDEVVMAHALLGTRLRLNPAGRRLLSAFQRPQALEELVPSASLEKVRPVFELLRARSFLARYLAEPEATSAASGQPANAAIKIGLRRLGSSWILRASIGMAPCVGP